MRHRQIIFTLLTLLVLLQCLVVRAAAGDLITVRPNRSEIPWLEFHDVFEGCKCSEVRVPDTDLVLLTVFNFLMLNASKKLKSESFGVVRSGGVMRRPTGLAYFGEDPSMFWTVCPDRSCDSGSAPTCHGSIVDFPRQKPYHPSANSLELILTQFSAMRALMRSAGFLFVSCVVVLVGIFFPGGRSHLYAQERFTVRPLFDERALSHRAPFQQWVLKRPRVGLVFSGGGSRGAAQVGVLKVLQRHHIPVDFIAAVSMGSVVGGLYAAGYTPGEIEELALRTNWDEVLSLSEEIKRADLYMDQKTIGERSFLAVRFEGLEPVIPSAVSSGQRLTNFLSTQTLQAVYHPSPTFDDLKIPFRAVATDLVSGRRVVLKDGSLAVALRASATVPLLFNPVEMDSLRLVDGGLVDNIPVDVARDAGCDLVIVINSTSGLRGADEMKAPWQTADQIMGIMMQMPNAEQLRNADVVITPDVGRHLSSDFTGLDTLIARGERAAELAIPEITRLYELKARLMTEPGRSDSSRVLLHVVVKQSGSGIPDSLWLRIAAEARDGMLTVRAIRGQLATLYELGCFQDVTAEVCIDSTHALVTYTAILNPPITALELQGCTLVQPAELRPLFAPLIGKPANSRQAIAVLENAIRLYRSRGYSLARIDSIALHPETGLLRVVINEGIIHKIDVQGGVRSQDSFIRREFSLEEGEVFQIEKARRGITNIMSAALFEYVYLEVSNEHHQPVLTIKLKERPSQLVRFGVRGDNERQLQGMLDIRDENFRGTGTELGLNLIGGQRNSSILLEYKARRLFDTYLTFNMNAFYRTRDYYLYENAAQTQENRWDRVRTGEYHTVRYGGGIAFGSQLERFGNASIEVLMQNVRIENAYNAAQVEERYQLGMIRVGTMVDTKNRYPFPTSGIGLDLGYEFALMALGSDVGYNAFHFMYENFATLGDRLTFHPKFTVGFADKTMPLSQQFSLGGLDNFFGLHEDDSRGRQLLLMNFEFNYRLPFRIIFDSYLRARYDLGTISAVPEEIKFSLLRHGIGIGFAIDTPIGPAALAVGKSFYLSRDLPHNPIQEGPFLFYFSIGPRF